MTDGGAAAAGAAAAAAIAQATKASGVIVRLEPDEFQRLLGRLPSPLVVTAVGGFFGPSFKYLTSYKGLAFFTKSPVPVELPSGSEVVEAKTIWMPS
jgi:hypothetical protein